MGIHVVVDVAMVMAPPPFLHGSSSSSRLGEKLYACWSYEYWCVMYTSGHLWSTILYLLVCSRVYIVYRMVHPCVHSHIYHLEFQLLKHEVACVTPIWTELFLVNHSRNVTTWCNSRLKTKQILGSNCHAYHLHQAKGRPVWVPVVGTTLWGTMPLRYAVYHWNPQSLADRTSFRLWLGPTVPSL